MYTFHTLENRNYLRAFTQVFNAISSILESQPRLVLYSSLTHSASPPLFLSLSFPLSIFFPIAWHLKWTKLSVSFACSLCVLCLFHFHFHFHSIFYTFPFLFCCCSPSRCCCCTLDAILLVINHLKSTLNLSAFLFFLFAFLWSFLLFGFSFILFSFQFVALFSHWLSHNRRQAGHIAHVSGLRRLKRGVRREVEKQQRRGHLFSVVLSHR